MIRYTLHNFFQELPVCKAIECNFPTECFADIVMVLEFLFIFSELFNGKQDFPDGVSLGEDLLWTDN